MSITLKAIGALLTLATALGCSRTTTIIADAPGELYWRSQPLGIQTILSGPRRVHAGDTITISTDADGESTVAFVPRSGGYARWAVGGYDDWPSEVLVSDLRSSTTSTPQLTDALGGAVTRGMHRSLVELAWGRPYPRGGSSWEFHRGEWGSEIYDKRDGTILQVFYNDDLVTGWSNE